MSIIKCISAYIFLRQRAYMYVKYENIEMSALPYTRFCK